MSSEPDSATVARLQQKFDGFAPHALDDPLYLALAGLVAGRPDWAALLAAAPPSQQSPTLWLAALHDRILELVDAGRRPALADYYPSAESARAPDDALAARLGEFIDANRAELRQRIATRNTQTNEIGRCAVLWPVLQQLVDDGARPRIALLDVGCSAGLCLGVDLWRYRYVDDATDATLAETPPGRDPRAPEIACRVLAGSRAGAVASSAVPGFASRRGIDLAPVDLADPAAVRWLRACLWPHDRERRARFDAAVAVARDQRWPLEACTDAAAAIDRWLDGLPADVTPVVFNSWVLAYFEPAPLRSHVERLLEQVATRGVCWISAEGPSQSRAWWPGMPASRADELPNATAWTLARPDGRGGVDWTLAATSHAHGRWMIREG